MKRILLEGPAVEPVLLAEAKAHLRVDGTDEDSLVGAFIAAARVAVETETRRALVAQKWRVSLEAWPAEGLILPVVPALSVSAVRAISATGVVTTLGGSAYEFDAADGSVTLDPVAGTERYEIDFMAGYGSSGVDVPQPLRLAMRMLVTHWYENRGAVVLGDRPDALPLGLEALVAPYRRMTLC